MKEAIDDIVVNCAKVSHDMALHMDCITQAMFNYIPGISYGSHYYRMICL